MKHTILCVDDEIDNVDALERLFRKGYRVLKAASGREALEILAKENVSLIISDQRMPEMTGVELLTRSTKIQPNSIRILLTGFTDIESVIAAINSGQIYRYVTKPWDPRDLATAVDRGIERYEMTEELKESNLALTKALAELKTLDAAKDQFMILINHELKTPLTSLLSFLELLKETNLDPEQKKYLSRVEQGSSRLKEIIFDVLELVSAETGRMALKCERLDVANICRMTVEKFRNLATEKYQTINIIGKSHKIEADPKILQNVLSRLLHNAVKFGEVESEIKLTVHLIENDTALEWVIENKGRTISKSFIERVMKPFNLDEDIMNHSKGMGLGLSVSQSLLKRHGSQLKIESERNTTRVSFAIKIRPN